MSADAKVIRAQTSCLPINLEGLDRLDGRESKPSVLSGVRSRVHDYKLLTRPRLSTLVLLATLVGFFFGSDDHIDLVLLLETLLGTALVAGGSSALNQVLEVRTDALMERTRNRPLPAGRMSQSEVLYFGVAASVVGLLYLALRVNLNASLWAAVTLAVYVFAYTPLKRLTTFNTLVGAVPGALPPLIGWAAARGSLTQPSFALFALLFVWQLPHFLAIAWIYRADYARAGLVMLPTIDPEGFATGRQIVVHSLSLLPVSLLPLYYHMSGARYLCGALVLGIAFLAVAINFAIKRSDRAARQLFLASVAYLPLLLALMMVDRST